MRYSTLTQIDTKNVTRLAPVWTYHIGEQGRQFESTPIVIGGVMYVSTQLQRIIALDPETGAEIWKYDPEARNARQHRGVSYWPGDKTAAPRILFGAGDGRLIALDAKTGVPAADSLMAFSLSQQPIVTSRSTPEIPARPASSPARGPEGTGEEVRNVIDYLVKTLGKK